MASEDSVDIVARGEGIVRALAECVDRLADIPGITFRSRVGVVVQNPEREAIADLDSVPFPDRGGIDINYGDAVARGLLNDEEEDWDKMFPVHSIYPDALDSKTLFRIRSGLVRRLIRRKIMRNPREAAKFFVRFLDCVSIRDLYRLLTSSKDDPTRERI